MKNLDVMYSSKSDEWSTPQSFFNELDREFHFDLDAAASKENHKCSRYFTIQDDGITQNWGGCRVFCNPPYSQIEKWAAKAFYETKQDNTLVVMLIPARTDTKYFHNYIQGRSEIRFVKGRLKFGNSKNSAPFPSMVVIWKGPGI